MGFVGFAGLGGGVVVVGRVGGWWVGKVWVWEGL